MTRQANEDYKQARYSIMYDPNLDTIESKRRSASRPGNLMYTGTPANATPERQNPEPDSQVATSNLKHTHRPSSAILQVIAGHQTRSSAFTNNFSLPPSIILQAEHGKDVALSEGQFLWNGCLVHVHRSSCEITKSAWSCSSTTKAQTYNNAKSVSLP